MQGEQTNPGAASLTELERRAEAQVDPDKSLSASAQRGKTAALWWVVPYCVAIALLWGAMALMDWLPWKLSAETMLKLHRYLLGAIAIAAILSIGRALEIYVINRARNAVSRFNLRRVARLALGIVILFIALSVLFVNWYAAVVSLGLISLILGFALQTPISSFVAWIYILLRAPYRVGDRIEIGDARGDVIDVSYLDTTVWEIGGRHLTTDHPSGRVIKFPNTNVFTAPVINYSWPLFPYVWNEIVFEIAYESDLAFVAQTMEAIVAAELGESMAKNVAAYRDLLAATPVNHVEVTNRPAVLFRPSNNTWVEAIVRYLVDPKEAGHVKSQIILKLLPALNAVPDKVLFPKSNLR